MKYSILVIAFLIIFIVFDMLNRKKKADPEKAEAKDLPIKGAYKNRWLFSTNEKDAFRKLKEITDPLGCTLLAKVRLLDLVEPIKGNPKYKTYFYKIQAKHVDFVICDKKLVARCIVELDDGSHDRKDRQERDAFVDEVLTSTGYQIIHTRGITSETAQQVTSIMAAEELKDAR